MFSQKVRLIFYLKELYSGAIAVFKIDYVI
jgi:hypothetical protein